MFSIEQLIKMMEDSLGYPVRFNVPENKKGIWFIDNYGWFMAARIDGQILEFEDSNGAEKFLSELV